uniref:Uncharacterized protein n=1 Tax=Meloidogyne incognita TaxID=6306 RepID=A0A914KI75_MELIC
MLWTELDCVRTRGVKNTPDQATHQSVGASHPFSSGNDIVIALPANRVTPHSSTRGRRGQRSEERRAQQEYIKQNRRITRSQLALHQSVPQPAHFEMNYAQHNQEEIAQHSHARQFDQGGVNFHNSLNN